MSKFTTSSTTSIQFLHPWPQKYDPVAQVPTGDEELADSEYSRTCHNPYLS